MTSHSTLGAFRRTAAACGLVVAALGAAGCPTRTVTIQRESVINTYDDPAGRPLQVDIVSVFPDDLTGENLDYNETLLPERNVTSDVWFARRPTQESMEPDSKDVNRFRIHKSQLISFTEAKDFYGSYPNNNVRDGGAIRGGNYRDARDKTGEIVVRGVPIRDVWHNRQVIYVFAKFEQGGKVLPTKPVMFYKVGDYTDKLTVKVGAKEITRVSEPKFHKSRSEPTYGGP